MVKCAVCKKEISPEKAEFEKGMFFCSPECKKKSKTLKKTCKGNVCSFE